MAGIQPPRPEGDFTGYAGFEGEDGERRGSRRLARYGVPVAIAGLAAATIGIGTALATTGGGPSLPKLSAQQLLTKMAASHTQHLSGSVSVTTDLGLPSALLGGAANLAGPGGRGGAAADPRAKLTELLSGTHTLRVAVDGPQRESLSMADAHSQYRVVRDDGQVWAYDSASHSVYHATEPAGAARQSRSGHAPDATPATPGDAAAQALKAVGPTTSVTVDGTAEVAGQNAYDLLIQPKQSGSTVGAVHIAVDAANGAPLSFSIAPAGGGKPVVEIAYTQVDFGTPAASAFHFTVPKGAHVTQAAPHDTRAPHDTPGAHLPAARHGGAGTPGLAGLSGGDVIGQGWTAVAELKAPAAGSKGHRAGGPGDVAGMLGALGKPVSGSFGSGTVIGTRIVNVLITKDGAVFAGAVTPATLVKAADTAAAHHG